MFALMIFGANIYALVSPQVGPLITPEADHVSIPTMPSKAPTTITDNRPTDDVTDERLAEITPLPPGGSDVSTFDSKGTRLLIRAAGEGRNEEVQLLLGKSVNVLDKDDDGWSALMHAAYHGHVGIVRALLDHGADIDARTNRGATSLIAASAQEHTEVVELLLARRAYPNARDKSGKGALDYASERGYVTIIAALREHGAVIQ